MPAEAKQENEYLSLHRRSTGDRLLYAIYWLLVILSWPIRLVGVCGLGISIVPVLVGNIRDPEMDKAITGTIVGALIFGAGFGVRALADVLAAKLFSAANNFKLGMFWARTEKADRAVAAFSRALTVCPDMTAARINRAACNVVLSKRQEAQQEIETVLEQHPDWGRAHFVRGVIAEAGEDYQEAAAHYRKALAVSQAAVEQEPESLRQMFRQQDAFALLHVKLEGLKQCISKCEKLASEESDSKPGNAESRPEDDAANRAP